MFFIILRELQVKDVLTSMSKKPCSEPPWTGDILKHPKYCWNMNDSSFIMFFPHSGRTSVAKFFLVISQMLVLFVNTLTPHDKYSLYIRVNLPQQIQMRLFEKEKTFSQLFVAFLESAINFEHFEKRNHSLCFDKTC